MDNDLNKSAGTDFATPAAEATHAAPRATTRVAEAISTAEASASSARVKRMRGWLGVKSSTPSFGRGDDGGPVSYGDAPNGWNR